MEDRTISNPIIYAYRFDGNGTGTALQEQEIEASLHASALTWVHLDAKQDGCRAWLSTQVETMDSLIVDALLAEETRPRILEFEQGVLLILRGVNLNDDASLNTTLLMMDARGFRKRWENDSEVPELPESLRPKHKRQFE